MRFLFDTVFPWWLIPLGAVLYVGIALVVSRHPVLRARRSLRIVLFGLRTIVVALVLLCLLNPSAIFPQRSDSGRRVLVLVDASESMTFPDTPGAAPRFDRALALLTEAQLAERFGPDVDVQWVAVGHEAESVDGVEALAEHGATAPATHLLDAIETSVRQASDKTTEAVILLSDGIDTSNAKLEQVVWSLNRYAIPVYAFGLGSPEQQRDVAIDNIAVKRTVLAKSEVEVDVFLSQTMCVGRTASVTITRGDQVVATSGVTFMGDREKVSIHFTPDEEGLLTYDVHVAEQDGEVLLQNNTMSMTVNATTRTIRVLYMEGSMYRREERELWEYQYLESALKTDGHIETKCLFRDRNIEAFRAGVSWVRDPIDGFPTSKKELLQYDVIISSDIDRVFFTDEQLQWLVEFVGEHGGGYVMIGGWTSFGSGGYDESIIDKMLPVDMRGRTDGYVENSMFRWAYTPEGRRHPILQVDDENNDRALDAVPYFRGCNRVQRAKPAAVTLAENPSMRTEYGPMPLLAVQEFGKGRSMAFVSDTTAGWGAEFEDNWGLEDNRYFQRFWVNAVRWLAEPRLAMPAKNLVVETPKAFAPAGEELPITATVLDAQFEPTSAAEVVATITLPDETTTTLRLAPNGTAPGQYGATYMPPIEGEYTVSAVSNLRGSALGDDVLQFRATKPNVEFREYRRNDALLDRLTTLTGGAMLDEHTLHALPEKLAAPTEEEKAAAITRPIWDRLPLLAVLLAFLALEWSIRRRAGLA